MDPNIFIPDYYEWDREDATEPDDAQNYDCLCEHDDELEDEGNIETEEQGTRQAQRN